MAASGDQLQDVVDAVAEATGCPTTLEDRDLNLVASSGHDDVIDDVRSASILRRRSTADVQELFAAFGIARSLEPLWIPGDSLTRRLSRWCVPVRWRNVTYGYIWLLDSEKRVDIEVLNGLKDVVGQAGATLAVRSRAAEQVSWAAGDLISDEIAARERAVVELRRQGMLAPSGSIRVVALAPRNRSRLGPVNTWLLPRSVLATPIGQRAALILPAGGNADAIARAAAQQMLSQHTAGLVAGIGGTVEPMNAHQGWQQASTALDAALNDWHDTDGMPVQVADWNDLGVRRLLAIAEPEVVLATLSDDRVARLRTLDSDILQTVRCYLDLAGSVQQTSAQLSIHRQTLYQRLQRVREQTGLDLTNGQHRLLAHLALTIEASAGPGNATAPISRRTRLGPATPR